MINRLTRVYKSALFILSAMVAVSRPRDALPTVCKPLLPHPSPCVATETGHGGEEVVCWADCCFQGRGELGGGGRGQETFRRQTESWLGKTGVFSHCQALAAQHDLLLGKKCHKILPWVLLSACLFLVSEAYWSLDVQ